MTITAFRGMKPGSQFAFAMFIILVSFILVNVLSILAVIPIIGLSGVMNGFSGENLSDPSVIALLKYFQVVQSIGLFVLPPLVIAYLYEGNIVAYLKLDQKISYRSVLLGLLAVVAFEPLVGYLGELNGQMKFPESLAGFENWMRSMEDNAADLIDRFIQVKTVWGLLFNLFMIAVIPAIGEELLFRGVIQKIFTQMTKNYHWGIWISAFLFSALHMQFYGFLPRMLLGGLFGYLLVYTGSIWLSILAHFLNNAVGVLLLHGEKQGSDTVESANQLAENYGNSAVLAVVGLILTVLLLHFLKNRSTTS